MRTDRTSHQGTLFSVFVRWPWTYCSKQEWILCWLKPVFRSVPENRFPTVYLGENLVWKEYWACWKRKSLTVSKEQSRDTSQAMNMNISISLFQVLWWNILQYVIKVYTSYYHPNCLSVYEKFSPFPHTGQFIFCFISLAIYPLQWIPCNIGKFWWDFPFIIVQFLYGMPVLPLSIRMSVSGRTNNPIL